MQNKYITLLLFMVASCGVNQLKESESNISGIRYFTEPNDINYLFSKDLVPDNSKIWEIENLLINTNIKILVNQNNSTIDTSTFLLTVDQKSKRLIDKVKLKSKKIYHSCIIVDSINIMKAQQSIALIESTPDRFNEVIEFLQINNNGEINKGESKREPNLLYSLLPEKDYFEQIENDSTIFAIEEKYGIERNTFAYKIFIRSPLRCAIVLKKYNQDISDLKIPISSAGGTVENNYVTISNRQIKLELNEYETGCENEYINLNKTYHR